jgi:RNA polymerase sigma-70 factor (ECF subfamily)
MQLYGNELLRTAVLLVKDHYLAEEIVQDTFVTAFQKMEQLEDGSKLKGWLVIITVNGCRARMRKWSWKNIFLAKKEAAFNQLAETDPLPEAALLTAQRNELLHKGIQSLAYHYREAITLFYFHELPIREISEMLQENENTVKTRIARGRRLLKDFLERGDEDDEHERRAKES